MVICGDDGRLRVMLIDNDDEEGVGDAVRCEMMRSAVRSDGAVG